MDQSTDRLWRSAQNQMSAGNAMAAAQTLHALLKRDPRHAAAHMTLGHIAWSRGRVRESAHHVLHVAGNPPSDPRAVIWTLWLASFAGASLRASPTSAMPVAGYACNFGWREAALSPMQAAVLTAASRRRRRNCRAWARAQPWSRPWRVAAL